MLSRLQIEVSTRTLALAEARGFAVAGGSGLIARGIVDRETDDIDLFAPSTDQGAVGRLLPALKAHFAERGVEVRQLQPEPPRPDALAEFARLELRTAGRGSLKVDLGRSYRLHQPTATVLGPTLTDEDLIGDKVLGLWDRANPTDFIDVRAAAEHVERGGGDRRLLLQLARAKDPAFDLGYFVEAIDGIHRHSSSRWLGAGLSAEAVEGLVRYFDGWRREVEREMEGGTAIVLPPRLERGPEPELGR